MEIFFSLQVGTSAAEEKERVSGKVSASTVMPTAFRNELLVRGSRFGCLSIRSEKES
jgi:hypothetical protein